MAVPFARFTSVAVFGGLAVDRIARTSVAPTLRASNPGTVSVTPGGVGFNVATALSRLGLKVRFAGVVGDDADGRMVLSAARANGIDIGPVLIDHHRSTASYQAVFDERGDLVIGVADAAICEALELTAVADAARLAGGDAFWVVDANFSPEILAFLFREAKAAGRAVAALPISPAKAVRIAALAPRPTILFANRREAAAILGRPADAAAASSDTLASDLAREGFTNALVTDSGAPVHVASGGALRQFTPLATSVASVNGGGDAFAAGAIYGLSLGRSLFEAAPFGLAAAALTVESDKTVPSDLSSARLTERIAIEVANS